jgi:hypothetical protein
MKLIISILIVIVSFNFTYSQTDSFEGQVTFNYTYAGEGAEQMKPYMQSSSIYYFKGNDVRFDLIGGMAGGMGYYIMKGDSKTTYMIQHTKKTAFIMDSDTSATSSGASDLTITAENVEEKILNFDCAKYKVVDKSDGTEFFIWLSTETGVVKPLHSGAATAGIFFPGTEGIVMKMETEMTVGNGSTITVTQTMSNISNIPQTDNLFKIPEGYDVKKFDPSQMFNGQ